MDTSITTKLLQSLEDIKQVEDWTEFRSARDLQHVLWYAQWRNFAWVIQKGKISCTEAWYTSSDHFAELSKPIVWWKWAVQQVDDYHLSRYACYIIAQNWDPKKQEIAFAQAYFAVKTRKQELIEKKMKELERLRARKKLTSTEKEFQELAYERWVDGRWIGRMRSKWDTVLFGGNTTQDMKNKLWVKSWPLADVLPTVTLKAKDLVTEVTNHNMQNKDLYGENEITHEHIKNNAGVREFLEQRGIIPEELPPEQDLKKIARKLKSDEKKLWSS